MPSWISKGFFEGVPMGVVTFLRGSWDWDADNQDRRQRYDVVMYERRTCPTLKASGFFSRRGDP